MYKSKRKTLEDVESNQRDVRQKVSVPFSVPRTSQAVGSTSVWYDERTQFRHISNKCGFKLSASVDQPPVLSVQSVAFVKSLTTELKCSEDGSNIIEEFIEGFIRYIRVKDRLHVALMPTQLVLDETDQGIEVVNDDSLIRLLFKIDVLQVRVATLILQKLSESLRASNTSDTIITKLIINQFRFLEHIVDSEVLCEKFFELIKSSKGELQLEMLACLPELADDRQHESLATNLSDFMKNARDLVVPILDTIGNLSFRSELLLEVRHTAISMLNEFNLKDIPTVVKFLFSTTTNATDAQQLFNEMRGSLDFLRVLTSKNTSKTSKDGVDSLFFSVLETFLKYQKHILDGAVRYLENISSNVDINVMDFVIDLILFDTSKKKAATVLIKQMIRSGGLNESIVEKTCQNVVILKRYFKLIYELCENLTRSFEVSINNFGCLFYRLCFSHLDDFYRQEIVGALVTHVGSGSEIEANSSLATLDLLINLYPNELCQFSIFLKNMLEFLPCLKFEQVRKVYSLLGKLASVDDSENGCIMDELNIIIRKNIAGGSLRQRANGVLCAVMLFDSLIKKKDKRQHALELFEFAKSSTSNCNFTQALLWDELSSVINSSEVDLVVLKKLKADVVNLFKNIYFCNDAREIEKYTDDEALILGLSDNKSFVIKVSPLSFKKNRNQNETEKSSPALSLAPIFRLLAICQQDLSDFVQIFDSSIVFLKKSMVDEFEFETKENKDLICRTIFHTVNWFRELINAFSQTDIVDNHGRLVERLRHVIQLQKELEKCLKSMSSFAVPIAGYYENDNMPIVKNVSSQKQPTPKQKPEKGRVTRKKNQDVIDKANTQMTGCEQGPSGEISQETASPKPGTSKKPAVAINSDVSSSIQLYYRELSFAIFGLLECNLSLNSSEKGDTSLLSDDLSFLLEDLNDKLKQRLPTSVKRSTGFLKVQSDNGLRFQRLSALDEVSLFNKAIKLIPSLLCHLDSCKDYFKAIIDENDGVVDSPSMWSRQSLLVSHCFDLIVDCLNTILSWRGHAQSSNKEATKEMFKHLANILSSDETISTVNGVANQAIEHFLSYIDVVSNLSSANNFLTLLSAFSDFGASEETKQKLSELAVSCLKREWSSADGSTLKGAKVNAAIKSLLRMASSNTRENLLTFVESLIQMALSEATVNENFFSETFRTLNKATFGTWYDSLFSELVNASKKINNLSDSNSREAIENNLLLWVQASRQFNFMTSVLKKLELRPIFVAALQHGKYFVHCFIQNCMNLLDHSFADSYENVRRLLSSMQTGTRLLQTLCNHSKIITKDKSLTKYVPPLKKTLEEFVYRVKAMMALNNCQTALSIAVLKTKNLQGEVLISQRNVDENSEEVNDVNSGEVDENENDEEEETNVIANSDPDDDEEEEENESREQEPIDDDDHAGDYSESY